MRKISRLIILIVVAGSGFVAVWGYHKYFRRVQPEFIFFTARKGEIQELVKARGKVASQKEFHLEFPFSGTVEKIFVTEGQEAPAQTPLIQLKTTDFELEIKKLVTQRSQSQANIQSALALLRERQAGLEAALARLDELRHGTRPEEIQIAKTRVDNMRQAKEDTENNLFNTQKKAETDLDNLYDNIQDIIASAVVSAEDAVNQKIDAMFSNDSFQNPQLTFDVNDGTIQAGVESARVISGNSVETLQSTLSAISSKHDPLDQSLTQAGESMDIIRDFLSRLNDALNGSIGLSESTINTYKTNLNLARTEMNTAISSINKQKQLISTQNISNQNSVSASEFKVNDAKSALDSALSELTLKQAGASVEQISAQEAQVKQSKASIANQEGQIQQLRAILASVLVQIEIMQEKIKQSTLIAPVSIKVVNVHLEEGEFFSPGKPAISLSVPGYKIETEISEFEIGKIRVDGALSVGIQFDALPGEEFQGSVISLDPQEVLKDGDQYYRVNVAMKEENARIRSGMSADLKFMISVKKDIILLPLLTIQKRDGKQFVKHWKNGNNSSRSADSVEDVAIETGISNGEDVEVKSGVAQGETVIVSPTE